MVFCLEQDPENFLKLDVNSLKKVLPKKSVGTKSLKMILMYLLSFFDLPTDTFFREKIEIFSNVFIFSKIKNSYKIFKDWTFKYLIFC